jgi:hypothetical protein
VLADLKVLRMGGRPSHLIFVELRKGEVRLSPGPMGENFSGSCIVTSRNFLIHNGATTATKSVRFDPIRCTKVFCHGVAPAPDGPFATVNFGEFPFFMSTSSTELPLIGFLRSSFLAVTKGWRSRPSSLRPFRYAA